MGPNILPTHRNESATTDRGELSEKRPLPFFSNRIRNELVASIAEFTGTFMFLFFSFGTTQVANNAAAAVAASGGNSPASIAIFFSSVSFGVSLAVNVWVYFRISGGMFNPAVTLGLFLIGAINGLRAILCFFAQILGGVASAAVVSALLPGPLMVATTLNPSTSVAQGVFLEMFLTAQLIFTIFMLAVEKHKATYLAPIGIGLSFFVTQMMGDFFTGGSLNPARSFGPAVVLHSFPGYHWIYWVGPLMGALLAFGMYKLMKIVEYQTANPGQDFDDHEAMLFNPPSYPDNASQVRRPMVAAMAAEEAIRLAKFESRDNKE